MCRFWCRQITHRQFTTLLFTASFLFCLQSCQRFLLLLIQLAMMENDQFAIVRLPTLQRIPEYRDITGHHLHLAEHHDAKRKRDFCNQSVFDGVGDAHQITRTHFQNRSRIHRGLTETVCPRHLPVSPSRVRQGVLLDPVSCRYRC